MRAIINQYGAAGIVGTVSLADFLTRFGPPAVAAGDAPPDGKPPARIDYPTSFRRMAYAPLERYLPGIAPIPLPAATDRRGPL